LGRVACLMDERVESNRHLAAGTHAGGYCWREHCKKLREYVYLSLILCAYGIFHSFGSTSVSSVQPRTFSAVETKGTSAMVGVEVVEVAYH
jgi:hypothetical protein